MTYWDLLVASVVGLLYGLAVAGALRVLGVEMPAPAWAAVVCGVAVTTVVAWHAEPTEPPWWWR